MGGGDSPDRHNAALPGDADGCAPAPDADAPWRRGYTGPPPRPVDVPPEPALRSDRAKSGPGADDADASPPWLRPADGVGHDDRHGEPPTGDPGAADALEGLPEPSSARHVALGGFALALALVGVVAIVGLLVSRPAMPGPPDPPVLPERADEQWASRLAGRFDEVAIGSGLVVVASDSGAVVALDASGGEQVWRAELGPQQVVQTLTVVDDVVVITDTLPGGGARVHALDVATGRLRWAESVSTGRFLAYERWVWRSTPEGATFVAQFLDPLDGAELGEPVRRDLGATRQPAPMHIAGRVDGRVAVYDVDSAELIAGPVDGADLAWVVLVDDVLIGLTDPGDLVAFDCDARRTESPAVDADDIADAAVRAQLVGPVPGHPIAIVSGRSSMAVTVEDGAIEPIWEVAGPVGQPVRTEIGPLAVARVVEDETGDVDRVIIDAVTGATRLTTDGGVTREGDPVLARNGYLLPPELGAAERVVTAFDYDGVERWSVPIPGSARFAVEDGVAAVLVRERGRSSTVTAYG